MSDETNFSRYKLLYEELRERVARLGARHREVTALEAQLEALSKQMRELGEEAGPGETEIGWETRACERCGARFPSHVDEAECPRCRLED